MSNSLFTLIQTSSACPESYNVELAGRHVGTMRLRHGHFCVFDEMGDLVDEDHPPGSDGVFGSDYVRDHCLTRGLKALLDKIDWATKLYVIVRRLDDD